LAPTHWHPKEPLLRYSTGVENLRAAAFFKTLDRANRYAVLWRIQTVKKAETRARKIEQFIGMLERKEKIHP
jgi:uncharacterized protein YdeI (YjbR/CyaY-like superfamily)